MEGYPSKHTKSAHDFKSGEINREEGKGVEGLGEGTSILARSASEGKQRNIHS
jgi:hypothetical protein